MMRTYLLALLLTCSLSSVYASDKPNVVLIFADDLGYGDLGCYGATQWQTPNLDQLAKEGRRFTDFYVAQAVCSASRAALLTGCYPNRIGIFGALNPSSKVGISEKESTLAKVLKPQGYVSGIFGKWHLGHHDKFLPTRHGFDEYFGLPYSNDMWPAHPTARNFPPLPLLDGTTIVENDFRDQARLTTAYTERAVAFINKHHQQPFFLYAPHTMPHVPLFVSDKFKGKSKQGLYGDVSEEIDWSVGQILKALKKHKLEEKTLVIFTSDNGPWLSYGNHAGITAGLREGKGTTFEGGVRVPCLMRWPGKIPAGSVSREPAMTIDLLPTLAAFAGAKLPELPLDGKDIGSLLTGEGKSPHAAYFFWWGGELQALRSGKWKLHFPHEYRSLAGEPGRDGKPGKYVTKKTGLELYDLQSDPRETTNVADQHPAVLAELKKLADPAREELGDTATNQKGKAVRPVGTL